MLRISYLSASPRQVTISWTRMSSTSLQRSLSREATGNTHRCCGVPPALLLPVMVAHPPPTNCTGTLATLSPSLPFSLPQPLPVHHTPLPHAVPLPRTLPRPLPHPPPSLLSPSSFPVPFSCLLPPPSLPPAPPPSRSLRAAHPGGPLPPPPPHFLNPPSWFSFPHYQCPAPSRMRLLGHSRHTRPLRRASNLTPMHTSCGAQYLLVSV